MNYSSIVYDFIHDVNIGEAKLISPYLAEQFIWETPQLQKLDKTAFLAAFSSQIGKHIFYISFIKREENSIKCIMQLKLPDMTEEEELKHTFPPYFATFFFDKENKIERLSFLYVTPPIQGLQIYTIA